MLYLDNFSNPKNQKDISNLFLIDFKLNPQITKQLVTIALESPELKSIPQNNYKNSFEDMEDFKKLVAKHYPLIALGKHFSNRQIALIAFEKSGRSRDILEAMNQADADWIMLRFFPEEMQKKIAQEFDTTTEAIKAFIQDLPTDPPKNDQNAAAQPNA